MDYPRAHLRVSLALATAIVLAGALATAAAPASAAPVRRTRTHTRARHVAAKPVATAPAGAALPVAGAHGMVVAIDPETGGLRMPSGEEMLQLSPAEKTGLLRSTEGLTPLRMADGTVKLDLQGRFMEYSVIRLDSNGKPRIVCVEDPRTVNAAQINRAPAPVHEVK